MTILPTLRQLSYLVALHDELHFGHAAARCNVTQSTLSAGIQELERLLDAQLVERSKRHVRFTPLGDEVAEKARSLLRDAEELVLSIEKSREPLSGSLRFGVIPTIAPFFLPRALPPLRRAFPKLRLFLKEGMSAEICDALARGEIDLALLALPYSCGNVEQSVLFRDKFLLAVPADSPFAGRKRIRIDELDPADLLLLEEGHCLREHALAACSMAGLKPERSLLGTSLHTVVQMVDNGIGITLLPEMAIKGGILKGTSVHTATISGSETPYRTIGLVWRRHDPRGEEFRVFAKFLAGMHNPKGRTAV